MTIESYSEFILEKLKELTAIDSPSGYTQKAEAWISEEYRKLGYKAKFGVKGGVIVDIGGGAANADSAVCLAAHVDTLGAMVSEVKGNGNLRISPIGGLGPNQIEGENCRIYTKEGKIYEGCFQICNASGHVNSQLNELQRSYDNMEVVVDEKVFSKEDTKKLGIANGDYVCFDTRTVITKSGYIKSRYLDDKLSSCILLAYAKYLKDNGLEPSKKMYHFFTVYEELGYGASSNIPDDVTEFVSVDMGCIGDGLECREHQVSICPKDKHGVYNYELTSAFIKTAKENEIDFATDIYPNYGSDAEVALTAGYDVKHALIGPGVYASHGYERGHIEGAMNTLKLIIASYK